MAEEWERAVDGWVRAEVEVRAVWAVATLLAAPEDVATAVDGWVLARAAGVAATLAEAATALLPCC